MTASHRSGVRAREAERGYALLTVIFLAALMIVGAAVAVPNLLTEGRREKEEELIWRGEQYARAVKLFYRKNGRFPQSFDQLTKAQNNIRFLRQAYPDPMNTEDGSWRLIYIAPNGQLIGSLTRSNIVFQLGGPGQPQPGKQPGAQLATQPGPAVTPSTGPLSGSGTTGTSTTFGPGSGQVVGGNIIGVGSKVPRASIRVYNNGRTYREWEFIWDPTKDAAVVGQPGVPGGRPGQPPPPPPPPSRPPQ
jgi:type II secretory pathway pseudopilin PulG